MPKKLFSNLLLLTVVWLTAFSCRTTIVTIGPLLPLLLHQLHLGTFLAGSLTALPLIIIALVSMPAGILADKLGHRATVLVALVLLSVGSFVPLWDPTPLGLYVTVAATGIAIGLAQPTLAKIAKNLNPTHPTLPTSLYANALVMGGFIASLITTSVLLPLVGRFSWMGVFGFWGLIAVITTLGWLLVTPREAPPQPEPISSSPHFSPFRIPGFLPITIAFAAQGGVFYALVTWLPDYFASRGWSLATASYPLATVSFGSILGSVLSPWLLKLGKGFRIPFAIASLVMALSLVGLLWIPALAYMWSFWIGCTTAVVFTLGMAAPAELVPTYNVGRASGMLLTVGYIGAVLGPLGYGALVSFGAAFPIGFLILLSLGIAIASLSIPQTLRNPSRGPKVDAL